jgi:membrane-associated phospholipid phosphatase
MSRENFRKGKSLGNQEQMSKVFLTGSSLKELLMNNGISAGFDDLHKEEDPQTFFYLTPFYSPSPLHGEGDRGRGFLCQSGPLTRLGKACPVGGAGRHRMIKVFLARLSKLVLIGLMLIHSVIFSSKAIGAGSSEKKVECLDGLITGFYVDTKHVLTSPFHWKGQNLVTFTTLSVGTFELMLTDRDFQDFVQKRRNPTTNRISKWTDRYTKRVTNLTIGGLYLGGILFHSQKAKETALLCLESVALAEGITTGIKHLVGRTRPFGNQGAFHFDPLKFPPPSSSLSFPSGHATCAFALTSVIAQQYHNIPLTIGLYGCATVVALARVNNNAHFLSDVFYGGVIGFSVGRSLVRFNKKNVSEEIGFTLWGEPGLMGMKLLVSIE